MAYYSIAEIEQDIHYHEQIKVELFPNPIRGAKMHMCFLKKYSETFPLPELNARTQNDIALRLQAFVDAWGCPLLDREINHERAFTLFATNDPHSVHEYVLAADDFDEVIAVTMTNEFVKKHRYFIVIDQELDIVTACQAVVQ